jgi:hypothetical protein
MKKYKLVNKNILEHGHVDKYSGIRLTKLKVAEYGSTQL